MGPPRQQTFSRPSLAVTRQIAARDATHTAVTWFLLIAVFMPATMTIYVGDAKLIPGRIAIILLLAPALLQFRHNRHLVLADVFVAVASVWMMVAILQADPASWTSAAALVLEFGGAYFIGRAFYITPAAQFSFVRILGPIAIVIVALAALEHLTQSIVTNNIIASLWGLPLLEPEYRSGLVRAFSTFPHPILYGTFCVVAGALFLFMQPRRLVLAAGCLGGCVLAVSSAPLISFIIVIFTFVYDRLLHNISPRWKALVIGLASMLTLVILITNKPISWIVSNLTFDPSTGYFRVATWDSALYYIGQSPYFGYGFETYGKAEDFFSNASVDSVWLTLALRFGWPVVIAIVLACFAAVMPVRAKSGANVSDPRVISLRTGFTAAIVVFMFAGLTVHYWNNIWIFWGLCLGIRASFQEAFAWSRRPAPAARREARMARQGAMSSELPRPNQLPRRFRVIGPLR